MVLNPGDAVGPYVVVAAAGAGGMAEVYKARDTRLNRIVALKVLAGDEGRRPELTERFAIEARAIAAVSHSHICAIYDVGHYAGRNYLVLEYLEGEILADRLRRRPLAAAEVLRYATEMADALDFAHLHGIVHRDLKPSNVFLCRGAGVKLLDFGLAKMRAAASATDGVSNLATEPLKLTTESAIVGTLPYMAPERLEGREADARADIFAYGAILYEMISGRKAFRETNQPRLIAAILTGDPFPLESTSNKPQTLEWVVRHCLAKDPDERWQSMGDVSKVLKSVPQSAPASSSVTAPRAWRWKVAWAGVLAVSALAAVGAWLVRDWWRTPDVLGSPIMFEIRPPGGHAFAMTESTVQSTQFAMSPDGQTIVFVARSGADEQLWIRKLSELEPRRLAGTGGASYPFWSPDSRSIGFFANGTLKKVGLTGRSPQLLCPAANGRGGTWQEDGTIVFSPEATGLQRVSAISGTPQPLTTLGEGHLAHRWPQFLPGGKLLFFIRSADANIQGIYVTSLAAPHDARRLLSTSSSGVYASGMLLYVLDDGILVAQKLDARTGTLSGEATPIGIRVSESSGLNPVLSASRDGALATWNSTGSLSQLVWYDRQGNRRGVVGPPDRYLDFRLSPDDQRLAVSRVNPTTNSSDIDVLDLRREGSFTSVSSSPQTDAGPIWSPDGRRLVFRSNRRNLHNLFERPSDGSGEEDLLLHPLNGVYPTDWSPDGSILFHQRGTTTQHDVWKLDPIRSHAEPLQQSAADEIQGQMAVGGRLAYVSDQSRTMNVFVRALNGTSGPINVSVNGGFDPRWRADGLELFYVSLSGMMMSAELTSDSPPRVIRTKPLFKRSIQYPVAPFLSTYVVTRDGARFLISEPLEPPGSIPIIVTLQWPALVALER